MSMAKEKATVSLDRWKVDEVRKLTGARNTSAAVDVALTALIRAERVRRDVVAYTRVPPTEDEIALARSPVDWSDLADDTDWAALYEEGPA